MKVLASLLLVFFVVSYTLASTPQSFTLNYGASCYANVTQTVLDNSLFTQFSIEAWIKVKQFSSTYQGVAGTLINQDSGFGLLINGTGASFVVRTNFASFALVASSPQGLTTGTWYHLAGVFDKNVAKLYMNGTLVGTSETLNVTTTSLKTDPSRVQGLLFGNYLTDLVDYLLAGELDDVRVWSSALTQQTISSWMNTPTTSSHPNYATLQGYYTFDESTIKDSSANANNGYTIGTCAYTGDCQLTGCASGERCDLPTGTCATVFSCFGTQSTSASVCSGHGSCTAQDTCNCNSGYTGTNCQNAVCFGVSSSNATVCSGKGTCTAPGTCVCNTGYSGLTCADTLCFNVSSADMQVCSGAGSCSSPDVCSCYNGYTGNNCNNKICGGIASNDPLVCSGRGTCFSPDLCNCNAGYAGSTCQFSVCNGVLSNETSVCSGRGTCTGPNSCQCSGGYSGVYCQVTTCNGIASTDAAVCSGHGTCTAINTCACTSGYVGQYCAEARTCDGLLPDNANVCFGNGYCTASGICSCKAGYTGDFCSDRYNSTWAMNDNGNGLNGILTNYDIMKGTTGRTLVSCQTYIKINTTLFGFNPICYVTMGYNPIYPAFNFEVYFSTGAKITVGDVFFLQDSVYNKPVNITVGKQLNPTLPKVVIDAPTTVGSCDTLISLDGSGSSSIDGRGLTFTWSVDDATLQSALYGLGSLNVSTFSFDANLAAFRTYSFRLTVANFLGITNSVVKNITRLQTAAPIISLAGGTSLQWQRSGVNSIIASATICNTQTLTYSWSVLSSPYPSFVLTQDTTLQFLTFPALSLPETEGTYVFQLAVTAGAVTSYQTVSATVSYSAVTAVILGGDRTIPNTVGALTLVSKSIDPEKLTTVVATSAWSCISGNCPSDLATFLAGNPRDSITYTGALSAGTYKFQLTYTVGTRYSTATVSITVTDLPVPIVSITSALSPKYARATKIVVSASIVYSGTAPITTSWTVSKTDNGVYVPLDLAANGIVTTSDSSTTSVVIYANTLAEGSSYEFKVTSVASGVGSTSASVSTAINRSPVAGSCAISPSTGVAGTLFSVTCTNWVSLDGNAFTYEFLSDVLDGTGLTSLVQPQQSNKAGIFLPGGSSGTTIVYVKAVDVYGSITQTSYNVSIGAAPILVVDANFADSIVESTKALQNLTADQAAQKTALIAASLPLPNIPADFSCLTSACKNAGTCSSSTGKCTCTSQYTGDDCSVVVANLGALQSAVDNTFNAYLQVSNCPYYAQLNNLPLSTCKKQPPLTSAAIDQQLGIFGKICSSPLATSKSTNNKVLGLLGSILSGSAKPTGFALIGKLISTVIASAFGNSKSKKRLPSALRYSVPTNETAPTTTSTSPSTTAAATNATTASPTLAVDTELKATSKSIMGVVKSVTSGLTSSSIPGEPTQTLQTGTVTMAAQRKTVSTLSSNDTYVVAQGSSYVRIGLSSALGQGYTSLANNPGAIIPLQSGDVVDAQMIMYDGNIYSWANNAPNITSNVFSLSLKTDAGMDVKVYNISEPVLFTIPGNYSAFPKFDANTDGLMPTCQYWDVTTETWSSFGCKTLNWTDTEVNCSCNHLTDFAVHSIWTSFATSLPPVVNPLPPVLQVTPNSTPLIICLVVAACYALAFIIAKVLDVKVDPKFDTKAAHIKTRRGAWRKFVQAVSNNHLWVSVIIRPTKGANYSRPQRVTSLFTFILATIMFTAILHSTYNTATQDIVAIGFASALLGLVVPNVLGWFFSHIGLQRVEPPPVTIATTPAHFGSDDQFEAEEYGASEVPVESPNGIPPKRPPVSRNAILKEGAEQELAKQLEPQDKKKRSSSSANIVTEAKEEAQAPKSPKVSVVASKIQDRIEHRATRAEARANEIKDIDAQNKAVPFSVYVRHFHEAFNDRMDGVFDAVELGIDRINCTYNTLSFGMIAGSIIGILLYYVCCIAIIIPLVVSLNLAWPPYLTDLFFLLATVYLILGIEVMYFQRKREHWNEWAEWSLSKVVIVLYSIAIAIVLVLMAALLITALGVSFWTVQLALGHVLVVFFSGLVFAAVLAIHLAVYIGMKPRGDDSAKKVKFTEKLELPSWSVYLVYAFAYIFMICSFTVTVALGYTKFNSTDLSNNWLYSGLIAMAFDIILIRPIGVIALSFFAPMMSRCIKAAFFVAPMKWSEARKAKKEAAPAQVVAPPTTAGEAALPVAQEVQNVPIDA